MPSTAAVPSVQSPPRDDVVQAAWRMLEAADTRCLSQVESPDFQALLRRVREASREAPAPAQKPARARRNGAYLGWLIDPGRRSVHVYRTGEPTETMLAPSTVSAEPLLPGFVLDLRRIL